MSGLEFAVTILIEIVCGGVAGLAVGRWLPRLSLGTAADALAGAAGGVVLTWLAASIPGVGRFVGYAEHAANTAIQGVGGLTPAILIGAGIAGLLGGTAMSALVGFARSRASD